MNLAAYIDHTLLRQNATEKEVQILCEEALQYRFASVCVNSCRVPLAWQILKGSGIKVCSVAGFPLGACLPDVKAYEAKLAVEAGAEEIDMVLNVGAMIDSNFDLVFDDIKKVVDAVYPRALVKVILETCLLTDEQKIKACEIAVEAGAGFVKTSTGLSSGGATVEDIRLMKAAVKGRACVKASGGIRTRDDALRMIEAGADRIGTSRGVDIVR